jgi:hypothetical protein
MNRDTAAAAIRAEIIANEQRATRAPDSALVVEVWTCSICRSMNLDAHQHCIECGSKDRTYHTPMNTAIVIAIMLDEFHQRTQEV